MILGNLYEWHETIERNLPWKQTRDPYLIYLSEIILQQTRVEQGRPYYEKFVHSFPNVRLLANASEDEVLSLWKGLGYYSRARNMHKTAKIICEKYQAVFPSSYDEIILLPGIGPYTAAAICSFAFDQPTPVVDGNVLRVVSRIEAIPEDIMRNGKTWVRKWMEAHIDTKNPGKFNQAMMDLGACCCSPRNPDCNNCPFSSICRAKQEGRQSEFPVKKKAKAHKERMVNFHCYSNAEHVILKRQESRDIWQGLYLLPNDAIGKEKEDQISKEWTTKAEPKEIITGLKQTLSHQKIRASVFMHELKEPKQALKPPYYLVERKNLNNYAVPKILDWFFHDNSIYLNKHNLSGKQNGKQSNSNRKPG